MVVATLTLVTLLGALYARVRELTGIPIMLFSLGMMLILPGLSANLRALYPLVPLMRWAAWPTVMFCRSRSPSWCLSCQRGWHMRS